MDIDERLKRLENAMAFFGWPNTMEFPQVQITPVDLEIDFKDIKPKPGEYGGYYVIHGETDYYIWAWIYVKEIPRFQKTRLLIRNVPGKGIVSGCCSAWDTDASLPKTGDAEFITLSAERNKYDVRVTGYHKAGGDAPMALGFFTVKH
ncbi:hypothetical protein MWG54_30500 (plasmid) [Bacillus cereus]|uniref:hypothetical protein n=1 Tax=Bacillus cereus TaxID=1396 RepID=UPI001FF58EE7|nr:hypothetical protein [Bacillus cereus]UOX99321.1 hypothetical protein MWG54_30500 [Bacillus cereus]